MRKLAKCATKMTAEYVMPNKNFLKSLYLIFEVNFIIVAYMALQKIVIDTCVLESAVRSKLGASFQILQNIHMNRFRFGVSVALYLEYEYRLQKLVNTKNIKITSKAKDSILKALAFYADEAPIFYKLRPNLKDENDNMVFECAVNYNANFIVTHNISDFRIGDLAPYNFDIITPKYFLKEVLT